jgi:hypothetical protein
MTLDWQDLHPQRPDRYLDWELQNRVPPAGERQEDTQRWCAVLIQVQPGTAAKPAEALKRLKRAITRGRQKDDPPGEGVTIRMQAYERRHLDKTIKALEDGQGGTMQPDDVRLQFFVYLPESLTYRDGGYHHRPDYRIRLAGPPIEAASFGAPGGEEGTEFPGLRLSADGPAVAMGIIDDGIAFAHERFRLADLDAPGGQRTRIAAMWLQETETAQPGGGVGFGRRLEAEEIDGYFAHSARESGRIDDAAVYRLAGVQDFASARYPAMSLRMGHGTHVLDLAAGFDPKDAREHAAAASRPILAVQLPETVTADTSGVSMGTYVLQALRQIMFWADDFRDGGGDQQVVLPLVVNFSYGICAGPKDGTHFLEGEIDRLVEHRNSTTPTAVVLASGNSYLGKLTASMSLEPGGRDAVDWMILPDDRTPSFVEIWFELPQGSDACPVALALTPPSGPAAPGTMPEPGRAKVLRRGGKPVCAVYYDVPERTDGKRKGRIFIAVNASQSWDADAPLAPSGRWRIALANAAAAALHLHLHIQRDDTPAGFRRKGRQSHFDHPGAYKRDKATGSYDALDERGPITHQGTLSAIGTGAQTVLVGAALDAVPPQPAAYTTSGPTPGRTTPDFSAIAEDGHAFGGVLAAGTASGSVVAMRGTSVAAPQVARRLAEAGVSVSALTCECEQEAEADAEARLGRCVVRRARPAHIPYRKHPAG